MAPNTLLPTKRKAFPPAKRAHPAAKDAPMVVVGFGDPVLQSVDWV